jgi:glycosyltransferase involved in cell wall biosynthesis
VRIALLTEGGYPYARGEAVAWCDRLVRGLGGHDFEVYALSRGVRQERMGWCELPGNVQRVRTAPLWGGSPEALGARQARQATGPYGRRDRRRFRECFGELAAAVCHAGPEAEAGAERRGRDERADSGVQLTDRFAAGLYGLTELARERGGLQATLRSELAVRVLQSACRAPSTLRAAQSARVADLLAVAERLERALRPLSLDWYGDDGRTDAHRHRHRHGDDDSADRDPGLAAADLCHAVGGGPAALPGLVAKRFFGTPLLITEYGVRLRQHYLSGAADSADAVCAADAAGTADAICGVDAADTVAPAAAGGPVRALLASFQRQLAREAYTQAQLITPGNAHARRWQERCGAPREKLRTVYRGMDAAPFAEVGERADDAGDADASTLVWVGRIEPAKDLIGLLHAFAEIHRRMPETRLRIVATAPGRGPEAGGYEAHCRALAAQLFPDEAADAVAVGESPVTFEELGSPAVPALADAYGAGCVVVLSSLVEGFPVSLVEAMFCGRATVSTDVGAVCEVIGGTGLVVPSRNPRALADSCAALLRDPARRQRLGAAARARALELFTVEQNVAAFRGIYLELMSRWPVRGSDAAAVCDGGDPLPFDRPAESHVPGRWAGGTNGAAATATGGRRPSAARGSVQLRVALRTVAPSVRPSVPRRSGGSVPSWARPDMPGGASAGSRRHVRTESREGESR